MLDIIRYDLHPLILLADPTNPNYYLCVAMMTSTNDEGTIKISKNNYMRVISQSSVYTSFYSN